MGSLFSHYRDADENDTFPPVLQRIVPVNSQWELSDVTGSGALTQGRSHDPHPLAQRGLLAIAGLSHSYSGSRQNGRFALNSMAKTIPVEMLVSVNKASLALQWVEENAASGASSRSSVALQYKCSVKIPGCRETVYFNAQKTQSVNGLPRYTSELPFVSASLTVGVDQKRTCLVPDQLTSGDGNWDWLGDKSIAENPVSKIPIVIVLVTPDGFQEHHTHAAMDQKKSCSAAGSILPDLCCVRQTICHQGQVFRLHELYGLASDVVAPQCARDGESQTDKLTNNDIPASSTPNDATQSKFLKCIVCFEKSRAIALWPCRHACFCREVGLLDDNY